MAHFDMLILVPLFILLTVQICQALYAYKARSSLVRKNNCKPPKKYPHKEPILGLDLFYTITRSAKKGRLLESLVERHRLYGRTFQTISFGRTIINTTEPKILSAVLATASENFGVGPIRAPPSDPFIGRGVFTTDGADWAHSRGLIKPCFTRAQVTDLVSLEEKVDRLVDLIPKDGSTIDLQPLFSRLSLDTSSEFLFGESLDSLLETTSVETDDFLRSFNIAQHGVGQRANLGRLQFLYRDKRWSRACKSVHNFFDKFVARAVNDGLQGKTIAKPANIQREHYILLDEMAQVTKDTEYLRNQILNVFLAGYESTAVALGSIFFHLARNRAVWDRLRSEVKAVGNARLTFELLKNIEYLRYVISENLRLNPVAPLLSRRCFNDTVLPAGGGPNGNDPLLVTRGQTIAWSPYALHRDASFWGDDVEYFRPERWETVRPRWEYLPFGGGTRICPAQQYALTEIAYVIVRLVQRFKSIDSRDPKPWEELIRMTLLSKNGVQVGMIPD